MATDRDLIARARAGLPITRVMLIATLRSRAEIAAFEAEAARVWPLDDEERAAIEKMKTKVRY